MTTLSEQERSISTRAGHWARQSVVVGLGLLALTLSTGSLGNLSRVLNSVLAVGAVLALACAAALRFKRAKLWQALAVTLLMIGALLLIARGEPWGLLGVALYLSALSFLVAYDSVGTLSALVVASLLFALYRLLVAYIPELWHVERTAAVYSSWLVGVGLMLGPTALGLPVLILFILHAISVYLLGSSGLDTTRRRVQRAFLFAGWVFLLLLADVGYIWLQPILGSWLLTNWPAAADPSLSVSPPISLTYLESLPLLFLLLWLVSSFMGFWLQSDALPLVSRSVPARRTPIGIAFLAASMLALTLEPSSSAQRGVVLFHDTGHLEWGRPVFGQYGARSGGTYGLWPDYLGAYGYETRIGGLTAENLAVAKAVVLINPPQIFSEEEKERLLTFVAQGGGLLIWGEHTGLGKIREPINDLLAQLPGAPIRLRFDSAVPSRQGWAEGLTLPPLPPVHDVQDPVDLVIAVGASLDIRPPAQPLVVGRFGHSDAGDVNNPALNFVGNMRYDAGELLGDLVLGAETRHGQGRIVVMGDTTPLGSVNLMTTMPFHIRLLDWVTAQQPPIQSLLLGNGWLAGILLVGAALCLAKSPSRVTLAAAALVLLLSLALAQRLNAARSNIPRPSGPIAYVDMSHLERFDRLLWEETSIGGLDYNLVRNGTLPLLLRTLDMDAVTSAQLLVIVAPAEPFSEREARAVSQWVRDGGRLLISTGWEESGPSARLLAQFGLEVDHIPLGPAEVQRDEGLVRFHEAWPVVAHGNEAQIVVESYGYPLILHQPWGKGGIVLVGDSGFLLGGNLEGETTYEEGNIFLLRDLLQGNLDSVASR